MFLKQFTALPTPEPLADHVILRSRNSYSPKQYLPPSRKPLPGQDLRRTAGRWVCRRSRWSKSTEPASQVSERSVTSHWLLQTTIKQLTISELEPLWSFMAFSCTLPMAASAHSAMEMSRTPEVTTPWNCSQNAAAELWQKEKQNKQKKDVTLVPVTLKLGATLLSASVNQMRPRLMQTAAETSARLYRLPGTQNYRTTFNAVVLSWNDDV